MADDHPSPTPPSYSPVSEFLFWHEVGRVDGRINELQRRYEQLDQHGSRGVESLKDRVDQLGRELQDHERAHERQAITLRWAIGALLASVVPLYPLILVHH